MLLSISHWRLPGVLIAGLALALASGCRTPPAPPPQLRVVNRLLDENPPSTRASFTHSGYEAINNVRKLVVAAAQPVDVSIACTPTSLSRSPQRPCSVTVPRGLFPGQAMIVETGPIPWLRASIKPRNVRSRLEGKVDFSRRIRFVLRRRRVLRGKPLDVTPSVRIIPFWKSFAIRGYPVLGVGASDFLSRPTQIPEGGVLTFSVGMQEPSWYVDSAPVQFTVEAQGPEGDVELYRRSLDPARRPDDRRWFDERVSLAPVQGRTVVLHFKVRPLRAGERRPALPMLADPTLLAPAPPQAPEMPTVVLVSLDTLRAKSMSVYGYGKETTPKLARFAATATRFANAYTTYSNTFGSHISMLTGAYPGRHGIRTKKELSPDIPTLAERLRRAGYDTAAFTEDALLDASAGFQRGFANYWENKAIQLGAGDAAGTFERGLAWLAGHRDRPAFLFLHTYAVHSPYTPAPPYDQMFVDKTQSVLPSDQLAYEQEIRQLDDDVAALVGQLDGLVPPEKLVLIITADHGEEFYEHGGFMHAQLYDEILHIPLFVRWAGRVPAGKTLDEQVSLVDVTPTILDLVGLDHDVDSGLSLAPLLKGRAAGLERELIFAESPPAVWGRWKWSFIARGGGSKCFSYELPALDRCFDLVADPGEQQPACDEAALWQSAHSYAEAVMTGVPPAPTAKPAPSLHEDPQRVQKLRALGYLD